MMLAMKKALKILALLLLLATIGLWAGLGAHRGWTQTKIPVERIDPVTEIKFTEWQPGFKPGVDVLALGVGGAGVLFLLSLFLPASRKSSN